MRFHLRMLTGQSDTHKHAPRMMKKLDTALITVAAVLLTLAALPLGAQMQPYNMRVGVTEVSRDVFDLHMLIFWICMAIGLIVYGVMVYTIIAHRRSRKREADQFHDSATAEFAWTLVPFLIIVAMAIPASKTLVKMESTGDADMTIKVTGYQWLWHYEYLDEDIGFYSVLATPREEIYNLREKDENYLLDVDKPLVLPTGKKVRFLFTSNDVNHAWWVPDLAVKKDAIPGFINEAWATIDEPGVYRGQCAELCGRGHGFMPIVVNALEPAEYKQWLASAKTQPLASRHQTDTSSEESK